MPATLTPPTSSKLHRSAPMEAWTKVLDAKKGEVQALVSVSGNLDSDGDIVVPGASAYGLNALAGVGLRPKGVAYHNWSVPIAKTLASEEVYPGDKSLPGKLLDAGYGATRVHMAFNMAPDAMAAREAFSMIDFYADEAQWSVGYETVEQFRGANSADALDSLTGALSAAQGRLKVVDALKAIASDNPDANFITKWIVYEYSPVLFGANMLAMTEGTKAGAGLIALVEKIAAKVGVDTTANVQIDDELAAGVAKDLEEAAGYLAALDGKAGRVLSTANEQRIRDAVGALSNVLDTLGDSGAANLNLDALTKIGRAFEKDRLRTAAKLWVALPGSFEEAQSSIRGAVQEAFDADENSPMLGDEDDEIWVCVEATYADRVLVSVDDYDGDPPDYYWVPYTVDDEGNVTIGAFTPVDPQVSFAPEVPEADDPVPSTGFASHRRPGAKGARKNHDFAPSADNAAECATCGAGRNREWHNDPKSDPVAEAELLRSVLEFQMETA